MTVYHLLPEAAEILGSPPFTPEYLRRELKHGRYKGLGAKYGSPSNGTWILDDEDIAEIVRRNRVATTQDLDTGSTPTAFPSGRVARSKSARKQVPA